MFLFPFLLTACDSAIDGLLNGRVAMFNDDPAPQISDTMMWNRDILKWNTRGHVDLRRMRSGGVRLQIFTAVTRTPSYDTVHGCVPANDLNATAVLSVIQARPIPTWFDLEKRALHQAERLERFSCATCPAGKTCDVCRKFRDSAGAPAEGAPATGLPRLRIIKTRADLDAIRADPEVTGAILGIEGVHWLAANVPDDQKVDMWIDERIDRLYKAGFRVIALTHRFHNGLSSSSEGCGLDTGLTERGRRVLEAAERRGMVIDLAHSSQTSIASALGILTRPAIMSHGGPAGPCAKTKDERKSGKADCNAQRNLSDDSIKAIALSGREIGIGFWPKAVGKGVPAIVRAMDYAINVLNKPNDNGLRVKDPCAHIGFGSDYDGSVKVPIDASQFGHLIAAMRAAHDAMQKSKRKDVHACFSDEGIRKIAGGNVMRVLTGLTRR